MHGKAAWKEKLGAGVVFFGARQQRAFVLLNIARHNITKQATPRAHPSRENFTSRSRQLRPYEASTFLTPRLPRGIFEGGRLR